MIEMGKQYRTRHGWTVSNLTAAGCQTFVGFATSPAADVIHACEWHEADGTCVGLAGAEDNDLIDWDLIEVKPRIKRTVWLNVRPDGVMSGTYHAARTVADRAALSNRIACIPIEIDCEEGEGL